MLKFIKLLLILFCHFECFSQCNNCEKLLKEEVEFTEQNYVGFYSRINEKNSRYKLFKDSIFDLAQKNEKVDLECYRLLKSYFIYFNDPHLNIVFNFKNKKDSLFFLKDDYFEKKLKQLRKELHQLKKQELKNIEGLWIEDNDHNIKIIRSQSNILIGVAESSDSVQIFKNQIRFIIYKENNQLTCVFQNKDHFVRKTNEIEIYDNELRIDRFIRLFRNENFFNKVKFFEYKQINEYVGFLRIPNCNPSNVKILDSILKQNHSNIIKLKKLIIDLRNNSGGSIEVTNLLLPYCTKQYIRYGSKKRNNQFTKQDYLELIEYYKEDSIRKKEYEKKYENLLQKGDDYLFGSVADTVYLSDYFEKPSIVYILINRKTGSAAEYFPQSLKGSKKVKIVGEESAGALIFTSGYLKDLTCNFFKLIVPSTQSNIIDKVKKRNYSIVPDIKLKIPHSKWVEYILNLK